MNEGGRFRISDNRHSLNRQLELETPRGASALPSAYPYDNPIEGDNSTFLRIVQMLHRRRRGFLVLSGFGLLCGILAAALQTPMYQAETSMEIEDLNQDFLNIKQITPVNETGVLDTMTNLQTKVKALQSEGLLRRAAARLAGSATEIDSWHAPNPIWGKLFKRQVPERSWTKFSPESLAQRVRTRIVPQTRDVEVQVDGVNPRFAATFANDICAEFVQENLEARWNVSRQTGEWLDRLLKEMRVKLERSESAMQAYANSAGLLFDSDRKNVSDENLRQTQDALSKAREDRVAKQSRYELARRSPEDTLPDVLDDKALSDYQSKLTDLERQKAEMSTTYTAGYSKLKRIQAEIATLEDAVRTERNAVLARVGDEYWAAARRESLLESDYDTESRALTRDAGKTIQYNVLQREVDSNRQAYDAMLQRAQEATIAAGMRASNIRLLDPAVPPRAPYKPKLILNALVGLFGGMLLGGVFVLARESVDTALRNPGDGTQLLNLAELGVILHVGTKKAPGLLSAFSRSQADREVAEPRSKKLSLDYSTEESTVVADSFRGVLTSLLFSMRERNGARVFAITSASPGEGKTTAAFNLGLALAEVSSRVLLIDGDVRRGSLSRLLRVSDTPGLVELLQAPLGTSALGFVQKAPMSGHSVLSSGISAVPLSRLLHSDRFCKILAEFKQHFDVILIDTPPVLMMPDARILGRAADGVILLTRAGRTTCQAAFAAYQRLSDDGSVILGTILNDWDPKTSLGSYYGYYYGKPSATRKVSERSDLSANQV